MLKQRIITASILFPVVLLAILYGSTMVMNCLSAVILLAAMLEWNKLIGVKQFWLSLLIIGLMSCICITYKLLHLSVFDCCFVATCWWILSLAMIALYPRGQKLWSKRWVGFIFGWILFIPTWLTLDWLHAANKFGPIWVAYLCFLVWGADIGGYFIGSLWGKRKLHEQVSAGKTWFGVVGSFCFAFVITLIFHKLWFTNNSLMMLLTLSSIVVVFSIIGDLVESIFKRIRGVKDSGALLPGHGGVLDRIDGLLAAVPSFMVGVNILQV